MYIMVSSTMHPHALFTNHGHMLKIGFSCQEKKNVKKDYLKRYMKDQVKVTFVLGAVKLGQARLLK